MILINYQYCNAVIFNSTRVKKKKYKYNFFFFKSA